VDFTFGALDLMPGESALIVEDEEAFRAGFDSLENIVIAGQWSGRLNNAGDTIDLLDPLGNLLHRVSYDDDGEWPDEADGKGFSLELRDLDSNPSIASNWRLSSFFNGTPGVTPGIGLVTVENWLNLHFTSAEQLQTEVGGLSADPDRDGYSNLLEFGFSTDPRRSETSPPIVSTIEQLEIGGMIQSFQTLTFSRLSNSSLQFALQESTDLEIWKTRPLIKVRSTVIPGTQSERLTIRENQSVSSNSEDGRKFLRIRVSQ
jgi:hypothetical protein